MKTLITQYTCDQCGKVLQVEESKKLYEFPEWAEVVNPDWPMSDTKEFHFCSHKHYKKYEKAHPDAINCNASFYAAQEWFK